MPDIGVPVDANKPLALTVGCTSRAAQVPGQAGPRAPVASTLGGDTSVRS
jgi:hypothetical protein